MTYIHPVTGICMEAPSAPAPDWVAVPGQGALFRRREAAGWKAAHTYGPDAPLWHARGWERVRLRPASSAGTTRRGPRSALRLAFAPDDARRVRPTGRRKEVPACWVLLPDEVGWESPAGRPGAQARFPIQDIAAGLSPAEIAAKLLPARILALGLPLERALWVLRGPAVSPDDARVLRRMKPVLELAQRLAGDLAELVAGQPLIEAPPPAEPIRPRPPRARGVPPARPRRHRASGRRGRASS